MADQKRLFLLDAYALIFRGYYAFIKNPRINSKGFNTSAIMGFTNSLFDVIRREKPDHLAVCFDKDGSKERTEMFAEYKANRDETPEPIREAIPIIQDILKAMHIPVVESPGMEADDIIGTLAKQAEKDVPDDTRKPSAKSGHPRRSSPDERTATPRNSRPLLPTNAAFRKGDHPDEKEPSNGVKEGSRSDLPRANPPSDKPQAVDRAAQRQREAEARKLMLEDGVPEQDQPSQEGPDLGDFEL